MRIAVAAALLAAGINAGGAQPRVQSDALGRTPSAADVEVRWRTDLAGATLEAGRDKKPLLVVFR